MENIIKNNNSINTGSVTPAKTEVAISGSTTY